MPLYGAATPITLEAGRAATVWNAETLTLPAQSKSQAISLRRNANMPNCISVELQFGATPGTFQVDVEAADTDSDAFYVMKASITALVTGLVARLEIPSIVAKFVRLRMVTRTNAVAVSAKVF